MHTHAHIALLLLSSLHCSLSLSFSFCVFFYFPCFFFLRRYKYKSNATMCVCACFMLNSSLFQLFDAKRFRISNAVVSSTKSVSQFNISFFLVSHNAYGICCGWHIAHSPWLERTNTQIDFHWTIRNTMSKSFSLWNINRHCIQIKEQKTNEFCSQFTCTSEHVIRLWNCCKIFTFVCCTNIHSFSVDKF